ncbi:testis-expressed protein 49 [Biomphalaria glabrata]|nr:testis-expressed protein 49 [Biomphalaria glabrata]
MSFFGLTHVGYQNTIKEISIASQKDPIRSKTQLGYLALPPLKDFNSPPRSIVPVDDISQYGRGPDRSYNEYCRLRMKHVRNPRDPQNVYLRPATTAQNIGWWKKDEPLRTTLPWTCVQRKPVIHSEMSKFVDDMKLTNKHFTLF